MPKPEGYVEKPEGESRGGRSNNNRHGNDDFKGRKERHRAPEEKEAGTSEN